MNLVVFIKYVDDPVRTSQRRLGITWKRCVVLIVHRLNMSQQWDNSCVAMRRAGIVMCMSWYYGHLGSCEHLEPHFRETDQVAPRGRGPG